MTVPQATSPQPAVVPLPGENPQLLAAEIDRSCRLPVLLLYSAAAVWLLIGALFGVITAIKAHGPGFLAGSAWLTYGRVRPVAANALVYGFVMQAGLGTALWMICRLGRSLLQGPRIIAAATIFWNFGLALGLALILAGGNTGYEWLEMPREASPVLFCAFALIGGWALVNLHLRRERSLYVSQWFLLTSLLWFPWVYSTAQLLLFYFPVRGVMQAVVNGWYIHNLFELCLAPLGLAAIFYLLPKTLNRPLHSRGLVLFGFWFLVLFGGWGGLRAGQPTPNWLASVSAVARVFLLLPILALAMSWFGTLGARRKLAHPELAFRFVVLAAGCYLLAAVLETFAVLPGVSRMTLFTLYEQGVMQLRIHGFLGLALAGAVYYVAPRVAGVAWPAPRLAQIHFWCVVAGTGMSVLGLLVGGLVQGAGINDPQRDFLNVVRATVPFLGINTLGVTLLLAGYGAFAVHLFRLLSVLCPSPKTLVQLLPWPAPGAVVRRART